MIISLELEQSWETAEEVRDYFREITKILEKVCEIETGAPADWYFHIDTNKGENTIYLTHL